MAAQFIPFCMTVLLTLLCVVPIRIPDWAAITPNLMLISLYHWTLYRPDNLPYAAIFFIGILFDLLSGGPLGLTPLILLIVRWGMLNYRKSFAGRAFPFVWGGFTLVAALVGLASWCLGSLLRGRLLEPRSFAFETVLTVAFYPVLTIIFAWLQRPGPFHR